MPDIDEKRRMVRGLLDAAGRGFADECGFRVTNNPASLFHLLYLSILLSDQGDHGDYRRAARAARALRDQGWDSAEAMASSLYRDRTAVLREASGRGEVEQLASTLGDLAQVVQHRYRGDLRRLRTEAKGDPARVRSLLNELPGVGDTAVDLFFRDVQPLWPEVGPFADGPALAAARKLPQLGPFDLLLMVLGTHKLSRTLSKDAVTSPLRAPFTRYQETGGPGEVMEEVRQTGQIRHAIGELITCPLCLAMWIATGFALGMVFAPRFTRLVAFTFAALTGADFLQFGYAAAQQAQS